jgi:hypothetical protein
MSSFSLQVAIKEIKPTEQVTDNFKKRDLIAAFMSGNNKEQTCKFELTGDRTSLLDNKREGDVVMLHFNLEGREYKDTAFNSLRVWKIE